MGIIKTGKIFVVTAALLIGCGVGMSAQEKSVSLKQLVNQKYYDKLIRNGQVTNTILNESTPKLELLPKTQYEQTIKSNLVQKDEKDFWYTYECLYFAPKPLSVQKASEIARSVSKMQGIKYYSNTKKKETILYKQAYMIENADSKNPVSDKNYGNADGKTYYCLMDDNSVGKIRYKLDYKQSATEFLTIFTNTDDIGLGIIRAIMPKNLKINLLIIPCEEGVVVYLCADLDSKNLPGVKSKITESMTARMEAMSKWFLSCIN